MFVPNFKILSQVVSEKSLTEKKFTDTQTHKLTKYKHTYRKGNKNSAEVDIAPAFGEITTACNVGQAKNGSWCLLEE